jgi:hypothetical protein
VLSDNHFAPDLRDRRPSSPRPRSGARFYACFSLPTFATGGGAFQERGMCPYLLSLKVGSLRYQVWSAARASRATRRPERAARRSSSCWPRWGLCLRRFSAVLQVNPRKKVRLGERRGGALHVDARLPHGRSSRTVIFRSASSAGCMVRGPRSLDSGHCELASHFWPCWLGLLPTTDSH